MQIMHALPARYVFDAELRDEAQKETRLARIVELEDRIFERAAGVVEAFLSFHEVTPHQESPPPDWVERFGEDGAAQRLAVAKAGWLPQSVAPAAAKLGAQVMAGIARGRGYRVKLTQNSINVKIELPAPTSSQHPGGETYPVKEIE